MQIDVTRYKPLSQGEKDRRCREGLCYYYGNSKHRLPECPITPKGLKAKVQTQWNSRKRECLVIVGTMRLDATKSKEKGLFVSSDPTPCFIFHVYIKTLDCEFSDDALLDKGSSTCFMDNIL
jgi:hypothetical protein